MPGGESRVTMVRGVYPPFFSIIIIRGDYMYGLVLIAHGSRRHASNKDIYFLCAGRHVVEDIPAIVAQVAAKYETVTINITGHVGAAEAMTGLILEAAICRA